MDPSLCALGQTPASSPAPPGRPGTAPSPPPGWTPSPSLPGLALGLGSPLPRAAHRPGPRPRPSLTARWRPRRGAAGLRGSAGRAGAGLPRPGAWLPRHPRAAGWGRRRGSAAPPRPCGRGRQRGPRASARPGPVGALTAAPPPAALPEAAAPGRPPRPCRAPQPRGLARPLPTSRRALVRTRRPSPASGLRGPAPRGVRRAHLRRRGVRSGVGALVPPGPATPSGAQAGPAAADKHRAGGGRGACRYLVSERESELP